MSLMRISFTSLLTIAVLLLCVSSTSAQNNQVGDLNTNTQDSILDSNNTTNNSTTNYNGAGSSSDSPPTAISPSYMSNGSETCLVGTSAAVQYSLIGISGGGYRQDENCNRRRDAKVLNDLGMKIAAVSVMCRDKNIWRSMFDSGTPCPLSINGKLVVGRAAYLTMKRQPTLFIPDYDDNLDYYNAVLNLEQSDEESDTDTGSISERFRSSKRTDRD